jgi:hypothetical protein
VRPTRPNKHFIDANWCQLLFRHLKNCQHLPQRLLPPMLTHLHLLDLVLILAKCTRELLIMTLNHKPMTTWSFLAIMEVKDPASSTSKCPAACTSSLYHLVAL